MSRHDDVDIHPRNAIDGIDPLRHVRVVAGRRDVIEGDIAREENSLPREIDHHVAERVGGIIRNHLHVNVAISVGDAPGERCGRRRELQLAHGRLPFGPVVVRVRGNTVGDRRGTRVLAGHDFRRQEEAVAVGVVAMVVRVDHAAERLARGRHGRRLERLGVHWRTERVDGEQAVGAGNHPGIAQARVVEPWAAGLRIRIDVRRQTPHLGRPGGDAACLRARPGGLRQHRQSGECREFTSGTGHGLGWFPAGPIYRTVRVPRRQSPAAVRRSRRCRPPRAPYPCCHGPPARPADEYCLPSRPVRDHIRATHPA